MKRLLQIASIVAIISTASLAYAADHIDGPTTALDPSADIADVFAFTSPNTSGNLVLMMNVVPFANGNSRFSDQVTYTFRARPMGGGSVRSIECTAHNGIRAQSVTCTAPSGRNTTVELNDTSGGSTPGMRVFAGLRSDPFFVDLPGLQMTYGKGTKSFTGVNTLQGVNVLSIVVEIDAKAEFGAEKLEVVGETTRSGQGRIDRMGLVTVTNLMLRQKKAQYNREDSFNVSQSGADTYTALFDPNLKRWDAIDGIDDWTPSGGLHPLATYLIGDYLTVDVTKPCDVDTPSYLDIDIKRLGGNQGQHKTCGGRTPNHDAIDETLTLLFNGPYRPKPRVEDGVDSATKPSTNTFPYLATPNVPQPR